MSGEVSTAKRFGMNQMIPLASALMAAAFIWLGLNKYGFWSETQGPMPGFFPVVIAAIMLGVSVLAFAFSSKEETPFWPIENWLVVLSAALIIGATFLIGLIASVALYVLVWLRGYEKCSWRQTLAVFAIVMAIVIGCFVVWLGVPFPKGLIFSLILG